MLKLIVMDLDGKKVSVEGDLTSGYGVLALPAYTFPQPGQLLFKLVRRRARQFQGMEACNEDC